MSKSTFPSVIASPGLRPPHNDDEAKMYDVVAKRTEKFVRPGGAKGKITVLYRLSPKQLQADQSGKMLRAASDARNWVANKIKQLKTSPEYKTGLTSLMGAQIKGNTGTSANHIFSADQCADFIERLAPLPERKIVRFVDDANTDIPTRTLPTFSPGSVEPPPLAKQD